MEDLAPAVSHHPHNADAAPPGERLVRCPHQTGWTEARSQRCQYAALPLPKSAASCKPATLPLSQWPGCCGSANLWGWRWGLGEVNCGWKDLGCCSVGRVWTQFLICCFLVWLGSQSWWPNFTTIKTTAEAKNQYFGSVQNDFWFAVEMDPTLPTSPNFLPRNKRSMVKTSGHCPSLMPSST